MGESTSKVGPLKRKKQKMDKQCDKGKKQTNKRHMTLINEEDVEYPTPTQDCGGLSLDSSPIDATVEDFPLTAPQPTQYCASDEDGYFGLDVEDDMPWKLRYFFRVEKQAQPTGSRRINFDCNGLTIPEDYAPKGPTWKGNASETGNMLEQLRKKNEDMPWKPRDFSEFKSRIQQRQKQAQPIGSRRINFDCDDLTIPEDYAPKGPTWMGNASETEKMLEQLRKEKMEMQSNKEKKQRQRT
ncbi:hypothetical protein H5410_042236 [Solanum commersonii]|uniref:Uncharacterized protein n=1 Tax=Solanum commersonii TaxID=4109 RepID=A0A9J5XVF4_SOLCO|nr:hypothetical protein H5410_042236 [Solanum commersonii]